MRYRLIYYKNGEQLSCFQMIIAGFLSVLSGSITAAMMLKFGNTTNKVHTC